MAHFAQLDENDIVINIIVADQEIIDSGTVGDPKSWIQTSYNTYAGIHQTMEIDNKLVLDKVKALRKNFAGIGYKYDREKDAFIPPKPYESWILNENSCTWYPPVPLPMDNRSYTWNEEDKTWSLAVRK